MVFQDRHEAGRKLAEALSAYKGRSDAVVFALPRGGVVVGYEVALALEAPLDVFVVRKLGVPGHAELAMGAIATAGVVVLNQSVVNALHISDAEVARVAAREERELSRRERLYRNERPPEPIAGRTVILVDDGLATGASMRAAAAAMRQHSPARLVLAAPVAAAETCARLRTEADEIVCLSTPAPFHAVGLWYRDFTQTSDEEVRALLDQAERASRARKPIAA